MLLLFVVPPKYAPLETHWELLLSLQEQPSKPVVPRQAAGGLGGRAILLRAMVMKLLPALPPTVTLVGPSGWPFGTCTVSCVAVEASTDARLGPKFTTIVAAKPEPLILTTSPAWPAIGLMPEIDWAAPNATMQNSSPALREAQLYPTKDHLRVREQVRCSATKTNDS